MENADWAAGDDSLRRAILDVALGETPAPIRTKRSVESTLPTYQRSGIEAALNHCRALRDGPRSDLYTFDESGLNAFGRYLMRRDRVVDAIRAFQLNVELYPASARAADALATAYEMDHNVAMAIRHYRAAVALDPELSHAVDRVKQLAGRISMLNRYRLLVNGDCITWHLRQHDVEATSPDTNDELEPVGTDAE
jgi:tetratricopeptide (TPR) repeat protein